MKIKYTQIKKEINEKISKIMGEKIFLCIIYGKFQEEYDCESDVDICVYAETMSYEEKKKIAYEVEKLHKSYGLKSDSDIKYINKTAFCRADIEELKQNPPFPIIDGRLCLTPVKFEREFLDSAEMRLRLLLNIFTTDSRLMLGRNDIFQSLVEEMYKILLGFVYQSFGISLNVDEIMRNLLYYEKGNCTYKEYLGYNPDNINQCSYIKVNIEKILNSFKKYRIIYITGASGSGTTSLGELIGVNYDVNLIESDEISMLSTDPPFQFPRPLEQRLDLLCERLDENKVNVIVGSINDWGINVIQNADIFILLYEEFAERKKRIYEREKKRFGNKLEDDEIVKKNFKRLIEWTAKYDTFGDMRSWKKHRDLYNDFEGVKFVFRTGETSEEILQLIRNDIERIIY